MRQHVKPILDLEIKQPTNSSWSCKLTDQQQIFKPPEPLEIYYRLPTTTELLHPTPLFTSRLLFAVKALIRPCNEFTPGDQSKNNGLSAQWDWLFRDQTSKDGNGF